MTISSVLVGQAAVLTFTAYADGTQTDLGTVTVGIVAADGSTVVAAGTSVTDNSDGTYTYTLAKQSSPGFLTVTWTVSGGPDFTTYVDVQGSALFHEAELRNFDDKAITAALYTDAQVAEAHQAAVEYLEAQTSRSWVRRYNRMVLPGSGTRALELAAGYARTSSGLGLARPGAYSDVIRVLSADDGSSISTSNIEIADGVLYRKDNTWTSCTSDDPLNVTVEYEYGLPHPVENVSRVAMLLARHWLVASRVPNNAMAYTDALGSYQFDETRLPFEAWSWVKAHRGLAVFA